MTKTYTDLIDFVNSTKIRNHTVSSTAGAIQRYQVTSVDKEYINNKYDDYLNQRIENVNINTVFITKPFSNLILIYFFKSICLYIIITKYEIAVDKAAAYKPIYLINITLIKIFIQNKIERSFNFEKNYHNYT